VGWGWGVDPKEVWMTGEGYSYIHIYTCMYFIFTYKSFWLTIGMVDDGVVYVNISTFYIHRYRIHFC